MYILCLEHVWSVETSICRNNYLWYIPPTTSSNITPKPRESAINLSRLLYGVTWWIWLAPAAACSAELIITICRETVPYWSSMISNSLSDLHSVPVLDLRRPNLPFHRRRLQPLASPLVLGLLTETTHPTVGDTIVRCHPIQRLDIAPAHAFACVGNGSAWYWYRAGGTSGPRRQVQGRAGGFGYVRICQNQRCCLCWIHSRNVTRGKTRLYRCRLHTKYWANGKCQSCTNWTQWFKTE